MADEAKRFVGRISLRHPTLPIKKAAKAAFLLINET
jgi:hypothetical protein